MKKNFVLIIGIVLMIAGIIFSYIANFTAGDITAFAMTMFGAGLAASAMYEKRDQTKKSWIVIIGMVCIGAGAFICGFAGMEEKTLTTLISCIIGAVAIIVGLIITAIAAHKDKAEILPFN